MSNSNTNSNSNTKLILTAGIAAACSAAITYAILQANRKRNETLSNASSSSFTNHNKNITSRTSFISNTERDAPRDLVFPYNHEEKMRRRIAARVAVEDDNLQPRQRVTVRVPASSANMGPGYDCMGMAVDLWSEITVERADEFEIIAEGDGADQMPLDETNLMVVGAKAAFEAAGKNMPPLRYIAKNSIPYARGLGSSSAAIVAGTIAGLVLAGHTLPCWGSEALLQIAASIEGHPDNVAPVIYGGIQLGIHNGVRWQTERVPIPAGMQLVMFIPDVIGKTSTARGVLGPEISRSDAAFNIGRVAWLVHALSSGNLDNLKSGVEDKMHQPQRGEHLYPFLFPMIRAAEKAGASCVYLSGAGPTVMALTSGASGDIFTQREKERTDSNVAKALIEVGNEYGIKGRVIVTQASHEGARVVSVEPPFSTENISYRGI